MTYRPARVPREKSVSKLRAVPRKHIVHQNKSKCLISSRIYQHQSFQTNATGNKGLRLFENEILLGDLLIYHQS